MSEALPAAESDSGTAPRASSNIRHLCRMELAGGGQIVIDGNYAYVGHQHRPQGTTILDIGDPAQPKERGYFIPKPGDGTAAPLTNDVVKDHRGLLWVSDKERGLDVIEYRN